MHLLDPGLWTLLAAACIAALGTPEDFTNFVRAESAKFTPIVKRAGITVE